MIENVLKEFSNRDAVYKFLEVIQNYNYCVIGGMAVSLYSNASRKVSPDDLDVYVSSGEIHDVTEDLLDQGFTLVKSHMFQGSQWYVFSAGGNQVFDVAVKRPGSRYFKNLEIMKFRNFKLKVMSKENLVINKLHAKRNKDIRDLLYLLKDETASFVQSIYDKISEEDAELLDQVVEDIDNFDMMVKVYDE